MRLTFQLRFHTHPGQSLLLTGNHDILGNDEIAKALPLEYLNDEFWKVSLVLPVGCVPDKEITYRYILRQPDGTVQEDWGNGRKINPAAFKAKELLVIDSWNNPGFFENVFYTEPFREVLLKKSQSEFQSPGPSRLTHRFQVKAPLLEKDQTLCLVGNASAMREWDTNRPLLLNRRVDQDWVTADLDLSDQAIPIEYKYGVYDITVRRFLRYEEGPNRILNDAVGPGKQTLVNDGFARLPSPDWRGAGVAIPVFSLRSHASFGVGEFTDLKLLVDWCSEVGLKLIQILPVNDTSATHTSADSYPYAAISAFALHPLYLNVSRMAASADPAALQEVEAERNRLNGLKDLDYEGVMKRKTSLIRALYSTQRDRTFKSREYREFFAANEHWLVPYAVFSYLRDRHGTADFNRWETHRTYNEEEVTALATKGSDSWDEVALNFFIQFHLHLQLREATAYAHSKGVILKGDIPIGVYRCGADAWQQPELYQMQMQAGAPPDAFGVKGQNWSFPTYDWERMKATGFAWWKQRFEQMGHYFDAFRIDHILGFFRIWSIPIHAVEGIMGHFVPAIPVKAGEFDRHGVLFDRERLTEPYITDSVLGEMFGPSEAEMVKAGFLEQRGPGRYILQSSFRTQRQVESYFATQPPTTQNQKLQTSLFDLISNVILLADQENPKEFFHFRFSIETTLSFKHLDPGSQAGLRELYIDYFFRRQDDFWMKEAMQKLPALKRVTNMLVCGEDLGMVPACVPEAMKQLGLLSLEVQRMPKRLNQEFSQPKEAPYLSVVTPSTHDMSTIRGWWTEERHTTQRFYNLALGLPGPAPAQCETWISRNIIQQHLASPAMWSIFMLQDLLGTDQHLRHPNPAEERINVPADAKNYWRYRMHLWLEDLPPAAEFNAWLKQEIVRAGR